MSAMNCTYTSYLVRGGRYENGRISTPDFRKLTVTPIRTPTRVEIRQAIDYSINLPQNLIWRELQISDSSRLAIILISDNSE